MGVAQVRACINGNLGGISRITLEGADGEFDAQSKVATFMDDKDGVYEIMREGLVAGSNGSRYTITLKTTRSPSEKETIPISASVSITLQNNETKVVPITITYVDEEIP